MTDSDEEEFDEDPPEQKSRAKRDKAALEKARQLTVLRNQIFDPTARYPREAFGLKTTELPKPPSTSDMIDAMKWANSGVHLISDIKLREIPSVNHAAWLSMRILDAKQFFAYFQKNAVGKHELESKQSESKDTNLIDDILETRGVMKAQTGDKTAIQPERPSGLRKPGPQEL